MVSSVASSVVKSGRSLVVLLRSSGHRPRVSGTLPGPWDSGDRPVDPRRKTPFIQGPPIAHSPDVTLSPGPVNQSPVDRCPFRNEEVRHRRHWPVGHGGGRTGGRVVGGHSVWTVSHGPVTVPVSLLPLRDPTGKGFPTDPVHRPPRGTSTHESRGTCRREWNGFDRRMRAMSLL